jgi:hypothetical protein
VLGGIAIGKADCSAHLNESVYLTTLFEIQTFSLPMLLAEEEPEEELEIFVPVRRRQLSMR